MKEAKREVILVSKIFTYFAAWMIVISTLCEQSTPVAAILGMGLYAVSTLAIVRGGRQ